MNLLLRKRQDKERSQQEKQLSRNDIAIKIEIEPIVKVRCEADDCVNNLSWKADRNLYCNLKHITITREGKCENYIPA